MHGLPLVGRSLALFTIAIVMLCLTIIAVSLRCFARWYLVRAFGWDDTLMVAALAIFISLSVAFINGTMDGVGHQVVDFGTNIALYSTALRWWWLAQILYIWSSAVTKISIALALLRLTVKKLHMIILYCLIGLTIANALLFFFVLVLDCRPISYFWRRVDPTAEGSCLSTTVLLDIAYLYSSLTILVDFSLGTLPIAVVWNLQMNRWTKVAVGGILSLGAVASVAVVVRLPFLHYYSDPDFLYSTYQIAIWSLLETGLGIIAGSLVTLRPLFRWFADTSVYNKNKRYERSTTVQYPLANLKGKGTKSDPRYWRPDIDDTKTTLVTSVSSPSGQGFPPSNSSEERLYSGAGGVSHPYHVSVHETITVTEATHASSSSIG
ncbi:P-type ATPase [Penicillium odoratum]|uniref:P-type ATPase n=1 Tax=Penicillium odoratum TaxID=1167516 RepID=UPI002548BCD2|nr:P-type ATPase [Penicillium odoratum]KAJ5759849.1 P-type ATPase [Penicillium odoratum]